MFAVSPVAAATSQNLSWGVADDYQANFTMDATNPEEDLSLHEGMYIIVTAAPPTIPNVITVWTQVPTVTVDMKWTNGTSIGLYALLFIGLAAFGGRMVVPIGNWTLLTEVVKTTVGWNTSTAFTSNSAYWGMSLTATSSGQRATIGALYLKSTGFLAKYTITVTNATSSAQIFSFSVIQEGLPNDLVVMIQDNILLIGIGVGVVVILGAVVCMKRK